jgi:hypothetical protein
MLTDDDIRELLLHNKNRETAELCVEVLALRERVKVLENKLLVARETLDCIAARLKKGTEADLARDTLAELQEPSK